MSLTAVPLARPDLVTTAERNFRASPNRVPPRMGGLRGRRALRVRGVRAAELSRMKFGGGNGRAKNV